MMPQTEVVNDQVQTQSAATPVPAPKPGYKSSELAITIASAVALGSGYVPANYQPLLAAVSGVYVACRTLLKVVHVLGYAKQVPDLPEVKLPGEVK